jgi:ATP-dependent RNA helicase RhlE
MGFLRDIKKILALLSSRKQNLLFSATFSKEIKALAGSFMNNPVLVEATPENTTAEKVDQLVYNVDQSRKTALCIKLISEGEWSQVLIFTRTKHGANRLAQKLAAQNISSAAIHGNKTQNARTKALAGFKSGEIRVLVATDIAARGLDIPLLPHVINFELPNVPEDYVHRIGRTGRAGASGLALSFVSVDEQEYVRGIEKLLGLKLEKEILPGFEPTDEPEPAKANPRQKNKRPSGNQKSFKGKRDFRR